MGFARTGLLIGATLVVVGLMIATMALSSRLALAFGPLLFCLPCPWACAGNGEANNASTANVTGFFMRTVLIRALVETVKFTKGLT